MVDDCKINFNKMIYTFFSGALFGSVMGLLFAPVSGKEARYAISNELDELKEKLVQFEEKMNKK